MPVPKIIFPLKIVTVEPGSALPVIVGVLSFVTELDVAKEVGAAGADVSIVMDIEEDLDETLPAESVAVALTEYCPSSREEEVIEKIPLLLAVVVTDLVIVEPL